MNYPPCPDERRDCACFCETGCRGLEGTNFKRHCPFYKTKKQAREDESYLRNRKRECKKSMNMIAILGRATKDPELRTSANGNSVARITVAVDFMKNGEKATDFFNCVSFGKTADAIAKYFRRGDQIGITGAMHQDRYKDKNGNDRVDWSISVQSFDFGAKKNNDTTKSETENSGNFDAEINDDDFPF